MVLPYADIRRIVVPQSPDTVEISVPSGTSFSLQNLGASDVLLGTDAGNIAALNYWLLQGFVSNVNTSNEIHFPAGWGNTLVATGNTGSSALVIVTKGPTFN